MAITSTPRSDAEAGTERWPRLSWQGLACGALVVGVVLFLVWVTTRPVTFVNDLAFEVTLTGCVDTPAASTVALGDHHYAMLTLAPGEQRSLKTPRHACTVFTGDAILGCLQAPGWPNRSDDVSSTKTLVGLTGVHWPTDDNQPCQDHNYGD